MSKIIIVLSAVLLVAFSVSEAQILKNKVDTLSYSIGVNIGKNIKSNIEADQLNLNVALIIEAMQDILINNKSLLTDEQVMNALVAFQNERQEAQQKKLKEEGEKNKAEGEKFLENNKKNKDVKVTPSGLQYKVLKAGTGKKPDQNSTVKVHYHGTHLNGKVFDSSVERGEPIEFGVAQVIPGWQEALTMMSEGSKWIVYIPPQLGYGEDGAPPAIGPNEVLIFEIELLEVK